MNEKFNDELYSSGLLSQGCWDKLDVYDRNAIETFGTLLVEKCIKAVLDTVPQHCHTTFDLSYSNSIKADCIDKIKESVLS
jgi:hypothetical protein